MMRNGKYQDRYVLIIELSKLLNIIFILNIFFFYKIVKLHNINTDLILL